MMKANVTFSNDNKDDGWMNQGRTSLPSHHHVFPVRLVLQALQCGQQNLGLCLTVQFDLLRQQTNFPSKAANGLRLARS